MKRIGILITIILLVNSMVYCQHEKDTLVEKQLGVYCSPPSPLTITKFESGKPLQIVVGEKINYMANKTNRNTVLYEWDMINGSIFNLEQYPGSTTLPINKSGKAIIKNLPLLNTDFGTTNGQVKVTRQKTGQVANDDTKTVKVFFNKDDINPNTSNMPPNTSSELVNGVPIDVPNWFYYWSQAPEIQNLLSSIPGIKLWDENTCSFDNNPQPIQMELSYLGSTYPNNLPASSTYGGTVLKYENLKFRPNICPNDYEQLVTKADNYLGRINSIGDIVQTKRIKIGEACGFVQPSDGIYNTNNTTGIHVLYSVVIHEIEHVKIFQENWVNGIYTCKDNKPNCLDPDADMDGYNDAWEMAINNSNSLCPTFFNTSGNPSVMDDSQPYSVSALGQTPYNYSAGTEYEECRCRLKEFNSNNLFQNINSSDWSFDKKVTNTIQGKQW